MSTQVQLRRGTAAQHNSFVGAPGEITVDTTNNNLRVHDGVTPGGHPLTLQSLFNAHLAERANPESTDTTRDKHISNRDLFETKSSIGHPTDTSLLSTATSYGRQINCVAGSKATGVRSQVNCSSNSEATGQESQVNASSGCKARGSFNSMVSASLNSEASANRSVVIASDRTINPTLNSIAGGHAWEGDSLTANRKWHIFSQNGNMQLAGQLTPGHNFTDFAEIFPNLTGQEQGYGLLQTIDGYGVRPAQDGEEVIGVTSATAGIILGDTPFSWADRWLKDEWGAYIMETVWDDEQERYIEVPKENPEWNPSLEQVSRLNRPDEWTVVGLVGQVFVRVKDDVQIGNYVKSWQNGVGQKSSEKTNIRVMKITQEYDAEKGYAIAFCFIK